MIEKDPILPCKKCGCTPEFHLQNVFGPVTLRCPNCRVQTGYYDVIFSDNGIVREWNEDYGDVSNLEKVLKEWTKLFNH